MALTPRDKVVIVTAFAVVAAQSVHVGQIKADFPIAAVTMNGTASTTDISVVHVGLVDPTTGQVRYPFALLAKPVAAAAPSTIPKST